LLGKLWIFFEKNAIVNPSG
jgi:hypothetical protein